jgi:hypothetical protein
MVICDLLADTLVGVAGVMGTLAAITLKTGEDATLSPIAFTAMTTN